jgi:hypothetical protein
MLFNYVKAEPEKKRFHPARFSGGETLLGAYDDLTCFATKDSIENINLYSHLEISEGERICKGCHSSEERR